MSNPLSRRLRTTLFYALRTAFRLTPMPQGTRDRLRQRFLDTRGHWVPEGPKGQAPTGDLPRRPYVRSDERAIGYVPYEKGELPDPLPATLVAFYLPQFHTIPENDEWWGKGFTEWRNVTRALPQFEGHYQPRLPGDLGFYDLRNVEVMHEQARLAREYGISAFCFYFYWFGGKTLLETPLRNWLNDKTIDLKFCLCWANEKWTRTWDGRGDEILIDQQHSPEDDIAFIEHVAEYMRDPRYLRVDGRPALLIYRPGMFPDAISTTARWRAWCLAHDLGEVQLIYVQAFDKVNPRDLGFDAAVQFPPLQSNPCLMTDSAILTNPGYAGDIVSWREAREHFRHAAATSYPLYQGVNPSWDNEARRPGRGRCLHGASPSRYGKWLADTVENVRSSSVDNPIFINAWNEWAEGAILEPDASQGYAYLDATRRALCSSSVANQSRIVIHAWYLDVLDDLLEQLRDWPSAPPLFVTAAEPVFQQVEERLRASGFPYQLMKVENRGRDIQPFLQAANRLLGQGVEVVLKLHTKKSIHLTTGDEWRRKMVDALALKGHGDAILSALSRDRTLGLVSPHAHHFNVKRHLGANASNMQHISWLTALKPSDSKWFAAGSMFWVRLKALAPLIECGLRTSDFEQERGQIDGTVAHAIERLFAACIEDSGYRMATTTEVIRSNGHPPANSPHV